jgi:8-oxo-dGTP pyrophosphatase MutT (NUDIX family)
MHELSVWQRVRTRTFLFGIALKRRMTLGARAALIEGDRVFLIKHTYLPGWQFPGGGVEPGETAEESAAREVLEETGHRMMARPKLLGLYHNISSLTNRDHVAFYVSREFEKVAEVKPNFEIAGAQWFDRNALPDDVTEGTRRRLAEIFDGVEPGATW